MVIVRHIWLPTNIPSQFQKGLELIRKWSNKGVSCMGKQEHPQAFFHVLRISQGILQSFGWSGW